jgi:hypothetical protein
MMSPELLAWSHLKRDGMRSIRRPRRGSCPPCFTVTWPYHVDVMPEHRAQWLAEQFISAFGKYNSRFATSSLDTPGQAPFTWNPATDTPSTLAWS